MGVMEARRRILLNQPHLIDASGNPIGFSTDMAAKMGVKAYFSPVQEGTGDPSPSNVRPITGWTGCEVTRCGKNLFDKTAPRTIDGSFTSTRLVINSSTSSKCICVDAVGGATYTITKVSSSRFSVAELSKENPAVGDTIDKVTSPGSGLTTLTVTTLDSTKTLVVWVYYSVSDTLTYQQILDSIQIELGSTVTAYEPYSGAEYPVTFPGVGKNLLNPANFVKGNITLTDGVISGTTLEFYANFGTSPGVLNGFKPGVRYTVSATAYTDANIGSDGNGLILRMFYTDGTYTNITFPNNTTTYETKTATSTNGKDVSYIAVTYSSKSNTWHLKDVQVEEGSSATAYEPFTNTLYGGYVDYEKGEVVATWRIIDLGTEIWSGVTASGHNMFYASISNFDTTKEIFCSNYKTIGSVPITSLLDNQICRYSTAAGYDRIAIRDDSKSEYTRDEFAEAMSGVMLAHQLSDPITYPLTPTLIKSLKGANTIWSDTNGNVSLKYWKR